MASHRTTALAAASVALSLVSAAHAQVKAFEGAEGFGQYAAGARTNLSSASVYHVTNLNDSGAGSFRDAVSQSNRFVVFDVGGIINIGSTVVVKNNVTIAGQTAPGGVAVFGAKVSYSGASNAISRYMAYRLGRAQGRDDASGASNGANMMFDHMSITWGVDETFSFNSDGKGTLLDNITVQNSIVGQGLDVVGHSAGGLMTFPEGSKFSLIRNLFTDSVTRNPKVRGENEFINNVVYGWETAAYIMGDTTSMDSHANAIGNYFIEGPVDGGDPFRLGSPNFHIYSSDNYVDTNRNGVLDGTLITNYPGADRVSTPFAFPTQSAMSATDALAYVLKHVGPSVVRDAVDQRLVDEVASYGTIGGVILRETELFPGYGTDAKYLNPRARLVDTDNDGMPDNWEVAHGLNPNLNSTGEWRALNADGRTRLEGYLNELGADGETILSTGGNWANGSTWNGAAPTLADAAIVVGDLSVTGGNAFARRLAVGGNLNVTGGTLDVFDTATIDGTLSIAGGTATFGRVLLGSPGTNASLTLSAGSTIQTGPIAGNGGTALLTFDGGTFRALGAPNIGVATRVNAGGGTIDTNGYTGTLSGGLSGTGTLNKNGAGTLVLAGDNRNYTGGINLNAGAITLATDSANSARGTISVANGTQLNVTASGASTPIELANNATATISAGGLTYAGAIAGPANSTLRVSTTASGDSNFSLGGDLAAFAGTIDLGTSAGNVRINQGGNPLAHLNLGTATSTVRVAFDGTTQFGALSGGSGTTLTGSTNGTGATMFAIGANNASTTFAGTIVNGTNAAPSVVSLFKTGTGTLTLSGAASSYTGATTINRGVLSASVLANGGANSSIGASGAAAANLVIDGGTLRYTGGLVTTDRNFTLGAAGGTIERDGSGNLTLGSNADVAMSGTGSRTLTLGGTSTSFNNFNLGLADPAGGTLSLVKNGAGTWRLGGNAKTYSGGTTVNSGSLYLISGGVLPTGSGRGNVTVAAGATLDLYGSSHTINGLNGGGTVTTTLNTARTLTVGNADADGNFAGNLTQGGGQTLALAKIGAGTQVLGGTNTFSGSTTVSGGHLVVNGSVANSAVTVQNAAALAGTGSVGSLTANSGSIVAPGNSIGMLTVNNAATLRGTLAIELDGTGAGSADVLNVGGLLDLTGSTLALTSLTTPNDPAYVLAQYGTLVGTFAAITNLPGGYAVDYAYNDGTGANHIALVAVAAVPEPTTLAALGALATFALRRRR